MCSAKRVYKCIAYALLSDPRRQCGYRTWHHQRSANLCLQSRLHRVWWQSFWSPRKEDPQGWSAVLLISSAARIGYR